MARLPVPGGDEKVWGDVLNTFLRVEHRDDGTLRKSAAIAGAQQKHQKGQADGYASLNAEAKIPAQQLPDASTSALGAIQLTGDLGGNATSPTVKRLARVFNIKDYGAVGDNNTDDTTAIRSALSAAAAEGGTVFIPEGTYLVSPTPGLQIPEGVTVKGASWKSVLKVPSGYTHLNNLVRFEGITNSHIENLCLDGNRSQQPTSSGVPSYTQYGLYFGGSRNCTAKNILTTGFTGVGIHLYDCESINLSHCYSTDNYYHGFEVEQCRHSSIVNFRAWENDMHGLLVSPGEVGGSGAKGNTFTNFSLDHNGNYGLALNAANGDISAFLCEGNMFSNGNITHNAHYGLNSYKQDHQIFSNLYIANNGYMGIYLYQSAYNQFSNILLHNNSQASHGAYDEILLEGANDGHAASHNIFSTTSIIIDGAIKARWAINEGASGDGHNDYQNVTIPNAGTSGTIRHQSGTSRISSGAGTQQVYGGQNIDGANAGIDNAFNILRLYSNLPNAEVQVVSTTGGIKFWANGTERLLLNSDGSIVANTNALRITQEKTPASAAAPGSKGDICWDNDFVYVCIANNNWRRSALAAW